MEDKKEEDIDCILKSDYSIDDESYQDSEQNSDSHLTASITSNIEFEKRYLTFIQAVKDDNCDIVEDIIQSISRPYADRTYSNQYRSSC